METNNYRILLISVDDTQYNALAVFEEELTGAFENMGMKIDVIRRGDEMEPILQHHYDLGLCMNGGVFDESDYVLEKYFNMPFYAYYVDHPLWMDMRIRRTNRQHCIVVDDDFKGYVDKYYNLDYKAETVMAGWCGGIAQYKAV